MRFTLVHYLALVGLARGLTIPTQEENTISKRWNAIKEKVDFETDEALQGAAVEKDAPKKKRWNAIKEKVDFETDEALQQGETNAPKEK